MSTYSALVTKNWFWFLAAAVVIATHLSTTFLTTLAAEDWRQCIDASSVYLREHKFPVRDYPWNNYWGHFAWSIAATVPGVVSLVALRSSRLAVLCFAMLAPLVWSSLQDGYLMISEFARGEVVTAQGGYHDCDRKGLHEGTDAARFWLYVTGFLNSISILSRQMQLK